MPNFYTFNYSQKTTKIYINTYKNIIFCEKRSIIDIIGHYFKKIVKIVKYFLGEKE